MDIGGDVTRFKKGDPVFGVSSMGLGTHADYKCLPEDGVVALKPANMSYEEAAGLPEALTALYFLRDLANIRKGQQVLINGASGAIGTYAVQLARYFGADVTGVRSSANVELVKSLGAATVIDYTREDFTQTGKNYDIIFDVVAKNSFSHCKKALKPQGIYLITASSLAIFLQMGWSSMVGSKKAVLGFAGLNYTKENLLYLKELAEDGALRTVIDRCYSFAQIAQAHSHVDKGHKKGNVVIAVIQ